MKSVILYAHPVENDGLSIQGDMLYRGMKENGEDARPCHWRGALQRDWLYRTFQPDIAIGIVRHPSVDVCTIIIRVAEVHELAIRITALLLHLSILVSGNTQLNRALPV